MNAFLSSIVILLAVVRRICLISDAWSAHGAACPSSQTFARLSQVAGVSCLGNSSFRTQSHRSAVPEPSNFVIDTIVATAGAN